MWATEYFSFYIMCIFFVWGPLVLESLPQSSWPERKRDLTSTGLVSILVHTILMFLVTTWRDNIFRILENITWHLTLLDWHCWLVVPVPILKEISSWLFCKNLKLCRIRNWSFVKITVSQWHYKDETAASSALSFSLTCPPPPGPGIKCRRKEICWK